MRKCAPIQGRPSGNTSDGTRPRDADQRIKRRAKGDDRDQQAGAVDESPSRWATVRSRLRAPTMPSNTAMHQSSDPSTACVQPFSRTPRPPLWLAAPSPMSSMPAALERPDQLHQRIDVAADHAVARLHALDRRNRQAAQIGELALIDAEKRAGGPKLTGGDHIKTISSE